MKNAAKLTVYGDSREIRTNWKAKARFWRAVSAVLAVVSLGAVVVATLAVNVASKIEGHQVKSKTNMVIKTPKGTVTIER